MRFKTFRQALRAPWAWAGIVAAALCAAAPHVAQAQIYAKVEGATDSGAIVLTDVPEDRSYRVVVSAPPAGSPVATARSASAPGRLPPAPEIRSLATAAAHANLVDPALVQAVIGVESAYNPRAVSNKGAMGLMQLMPGTASRFGVRDVFDARDNINGGARYLRYLLNLFDNNLELALAAYNAGENAVIRAGYRVPNYPETRAYVPKVMTLYHQFKG
ncbi:MAG: lytic transglycosylase domain-containing protein [Betaproteobacteria bacterium]|nr:lytic transglycosylase domain-containing protein [Betaproteobacteria bacterium]